MTGPGSSGNGQSRVRGLVLKALVLIGGALLLKKFTKSTTRWDHARAVAQSLSGEKVLSFLFSSNFQMTFSVRFFFFLVFELSLFFFNLFVL